MGRRTRPTPVADPSVENDLDVGQTPELQAQLLEEVEPIPMDDAQSLSHAALVVIPGCLVPIRVALLTVKPYQR